MPRSHPAPKPLAGLYLPQIRMDFGSIEARARAAEAAGYHSVWFMDHLAPPAGRELDCLESWTVATAVAMRAERIRVGHLVLSNELRHPALLAKMAASLDVDSGGRLELGLGWGSAPRELDDYGFGDPGAELRAERRFGAWGGVVAGTPDEVAAALRKERDAGAELFICQFHDFGKPETIRLFAEEVLPALA